MARILIVHPDENYRQRYVEIVRELGHEAVVVEAKEGESYAMVALVIVADVKKMEQLDCDAILICWHLGDNSYQITGDILANTLSDWGDEGHLIISISYNRVPHFDDPFDAYLSPVEFGGKDLFVQKLREVLSVFVTGETEIAKV